MNAGRRWQRVRHFAMNRWVFAASYLAAGCVTPSAPQSNSGVPNTCAERPSSPTRPQLTAAAAAAFSVQNYLAAAGPVAAPVPDFWDPSGGLPRATSYQPDYVVAADGSGSHRTLTAALARASGSQRQYVLIKPGTYREIVNIPATAPPLTLYGLEKDASRVLIVQNQSAAKAGGTAKSATFTVHSSGFHAQNISISNDFETPSKGVGLQAVALKTTGDRVVLENVRLHGFQDTLYLDSYSELSTSRVYIKNSHIEGDTDFIFGRATAVIEDSTLHCLHSRKGDTPGIMLAPSTHVAQKYGFLVIGCRFTAPEGAPKRSAYLGRAWDTSSTVPTPNGQALIRDSVLGDHVRVSDPWAPAATSARPYSATDNRLFEYCNSDARLD